MKKIFLSLILFLTAVTAAHATATAEIQNCDVKTYKDFIIRKYMTNGFRVQFPNEYSLVASKEISGAGTKMLMKMVAGTRTNNRLEAQANYNFIQSGKNVLVQLTIVSVSDSGTTFQKIRNTSPQQEINELNAVNAEFIGNLKNDKK